MILKVSFLILVSITLIFALPYTKDSGVINLDKSNFADQVFGTEHVWLVEFYAPWCGHCKNLAPEYEKLAKNMKGIVKIAAVNADVEKELASNFGIQGFPTIKLFPSKMKMVDSGKGVTKEPIDYQGPRTAAAMAEFAISHLPNFVVSVTSKTYQKFMETDSNLAHVLLFSNKKEVTTLLKAVAIDFHHGLNIGFVKDTEKDLVEQYKITKYPTLIVIPTEGEPQLYNGELKHDALFKFLKPFSPERMNSPKVEEKKVKETVPKRNVREEVMNQASFESLCYNKAASCILTFLDPENSGSEAHEKYLDILENVNEKNGDKFTFLWLDGLKQFEFADFFNIASGFPNVILINQKKMLSLPYIGAFDEKSIQDFLDRVLRNAIRPSAIKTIPNLSLKKDEL